MPFFPPRGPHLPFQPPVDPFRIFYGLTGITMVAFFTGFSSCLFDLSQVKECVDYAEQATATFRKVGDHLIAWFIALIKEVFHRNGLFY